jgi:hypothetical protein
LQGKLRIGRRRRAVSLTGSPGVKDHYFLSYGAKKFQPEKKRSCKIKRRSADRNRSSGVWLLVQLDEDEKIL